jgi:hypothetical protein
MSIADYSYFPLLYWLRCLDKETYPQTGAKVEIQDLALSQENLAYLTNKLQALIDENLGSCMIFDVVQLLK